MSAVSLAERYHQLCQELADYPLARLVAVSKYASVDQVRALYALGHRDFGENYIPALLEKQTALSDLDIRWHLIGHLQSNKVKKAIAANCALIQSVDSLSLAQKLDQAAQASGRIQPILLQLNLTQEPQKTGLSTSNYWESLSTLLSLPSVSIQGLMTLGHADSPIDPTPFAQLAEIRQQTHERLGIHFPELSMGMSGDYHHALQYGATIIRVGSALFGG